MKTQFKRGFSWRDENGYYPTPAGGKYPSVTTVLGGLEDFLWVHIAEIKKLVSSLSDKIDTGETHELWEYDGESYQLTAHKPTKVIRDGDYISKGGLRFLKQCADRGSLCHEIICDYAEGAAGGHLAERCEELIVEKGYSCSVDLALPFARNLWKWLSDNKPQIYWSEAPVYSDAHGYAGTCDGIMLLNGNLVCFDCKTQNSYSAKRSHFAQVSAYARAEYILRHDKTVETMPTLMGAPIPCGVLYVTPDKAGMRHVEHSQDYFDELFIPALKAFTAHKKLPMPKDQCAWI